VIAVVWVFEWANARRSSGSWTVAAFWSSGSPGNWMNRIGRRPERWAVVAGGLLVIAAVASTLASPAPRVSLWGRDNLGLGYELYSFLALLTVFFTVALRMKTTQ
jgi:hypothetical protein